jgi:serine/threonine protein kinase
MQVLSKPTAEDVFHKVLFNGMAEEELPQYDEKVDIWSLGVVLLEAMTGRQPFLADCAKEMIPLQQQKLAELGPDGCTPLFISRSGLSPDAIDILTKMLCEAPEKRASADELLRHSWIQQVTLA